MSTIKVDKITGRTGTGGASSPLQFAGDTLDVGSTVLPKTDDTYDLGSSDKEWTTVYAGALVSGDIIMKNQEGHFTIDEQADYLRVYNHSTGKYYKLLMEEI